MAVPRYFDFITPNEIAFATDFNRFYTDSELRPFRNMAKSFNTTIRIVYGQKEIRALTELQQCNLSLLRNYLENVEYFVHTVSESNSITKSLEVFTEELDIHLLVMHNYQHSFLENFT